MTEGWKQARRSGRSRRTEFVRARVDPAFADRLDFACLRAGLPMSEFIRRALAARIEEVEQAAAVHSESLAGANEAA